MVSENQKSYFVSLLYGLTITNYLPSCISPLINSFTHSLSIVYDAVIKSCALIKKVLPV